MQITKSPIASAGGGWVPQQKTGYRLLVTPKGVNIQDILQFAMKSMTFPGTGEVETKETKLYNEIRKWAGGPAKFEALSLKLNDYVDKRVMEAMEAWHRLVFNPVTGTMGNPADYKVNGTIILGTVDGNAALDRKWTAHGLWPKVVKMGEGEQGSADQVEIVATLEVDWIDHEGA